MKSIYIPISLMVLFGCASDLFLIDGTYTHPDRFPIPFIPVATNTLSLDFDTAVLPLDDSLTLANAVHTANRIAEYDEKIKKAFSVMSQDPLGVKDSIKYWFLTEDGDIKRVLFGKTTGNHFMKFAEVTFAGKQMESGFFSIPVYDSPQSDSMAAALESALNNIIPVLSGYESAYKYCLLKCADAYCIYFIPASTNKEIALGGGVLRTVGGMDMKLEETRALHAGTLKVPDTTREIMHTNVYDSLPNEVDLAQMLIYRYHIPNKIIKTGKYIVSFTFNPDSNTFYYTTYKTPR